MFNVHNHCVAHHPGITQILDYSKELIDEVLKKYINTKVFRIIEIKP